jgi:hypothetical protein
MTPSMPERTAVVPSDRCISAPALVATTSGATPRINAREFIGIGRSLASAALTAASAGGETLLLDLSRNFYDQDHVLAARPTKTTKSICARTSMGKPRVSKPVIDASRHIGTIMTTASGNFQFSYSAASTRKTNRAAAPKMSEDSALRRGRCPPAPHRASDPGR